jgi:hypothetical protein
MHIIITTIYSLQEPNLNHENYSEHELNIGNFVQANEWCAHVCKDSIHEYAQIFII